MHAAMWTPFARYPLMFVTLQQCHKMNVSVVKTYYIPDQKISQENIQQLPFLY